MNKFYYCGLSLDELKKFDGEVIAIALLRDSSTLIKNPDDNLLTLLTLAGVRFAKVAIIDVIRKEYGYTDMGMLEDFMTK